MLNTHRARDPQWCSNMISVTTVVENVFCPKFTYYGHVMGLEQYEEKRGSVKSGKRHHAISEKTNKEFIPDNLTGTKITSQKLYSKKYGFVGIIDHAVEMKDHMVLIERKYADHNNIHESVLVQLGLLAVLLEENFEKPVLYAYVYFAKNGKRTKLQVDIDQNVIDHALKMLDETKNNINSATIPESQYDNRCINCCYRKICDVGSLNNL